MNGINPFRGDNLHLHFLIMEKNISPVNVTLLFWSLTAIFGIIALTLTNSSSLPYLGVVLYASLLLGVFTVRLARKRHIRGEGRHAAPFPAGMRAYPSGPSRHYAISPGVARKEGMIRFKWIVVLVSIFLPAQTYAGKAGVSRTQQDNTAVASGEPAKLEISSIQFD